MSKLRTTTGNAWAAVDVLLKHIGEDPAREGLADTPQRVVRALMEMTSGYRQSPEEVLGVTFAAEDYDELVMLRGIRFTSLCEHHLLPFSGVAHVGYIPKMRVVGLSKLARLVDIYAKRLQLQERMTQQIAHALINFLDPVGAGVVVCAQHSCMGCRGVRQPDAEMVTSTMLRAFRADEKARAEFLALVSGA